MYAHDRKRVGDRENLETERRSDLRLTSTADRVTVNGELRGIVDALDLEVVIDSFGACADSCPADVNFDGMVDGGDFALVLEAWNAACDG